MRSTKLATNCVYGAVIWEFFSYFGMRALLMLYLTQKLLFTDHKAYAIFGAYTSLIFVMPIIGGYIADRLIGYRDTVLMGCLLIVIGHISLFMQGINNLYLGLALLVVGVGLFKTNAICLVGQTADDGAQSKNSVYALYYVFANIGATLGPIVAAFVAQKIGWHYGFGVAGLGMLLGVCCLMFAISRGVLAQRAPVERVKRSYYVGIIAFIIVSVIAITLVIKALVAGYVLSAVALLGALYAVYMCKQSGKLERKKLGMILLLTLFATVFWAFDMQSASSVSMFILRNINRHGIPTAMFQSINPFIIVIFGVVLAWVWRVLHKKGFDFSGILKLALGFLVLTLGFVLIALGAHNASKTGLASMWWPVFGLCLIGMAELFIDPVVLSRINQDVSKRFLGVVTGAYYLFVGSFANYTAAKIAQLTSIGSSVGAKVDRLTAALTYQSTYVEVVWVGLTICVVLLIWWGVHKVMR